MSLRTSLVSFMILLAILPFGALLFWHSHIGAVREMAVAEDRLRYAVHHIALLPDKERDGRAFVDIDFERIDLTGFRDMYAGNAGVEIAVLHATSQIISSPPLSWLKDNEQFRAISSFVTTSVGED